jgi:glycosyltransferase involved in cell wall biosynthesis
VKLAIIVPSLRNVGPVRVAYDLVCALVHKPDFEVTVFYLDENVELEFPCEVKKLRLDTLLSLYSFDLIHSHMIKPDFINAFLPFFNGKKVSTIHNMVEADLYYSHGIILSKIISKLWLVLWKRLDKRVVLSDVAINYYAELGLNSNKNIRIYNGVAGEKVVLTKQDSNWERIIDLKKQYSVLGTISLFNHRKGLDQVIKALPYMENCVFVVIGDGPIKNELQSLACELGVEDRVLFLGFLHNARAYLSAFDIYMMPSREEGFCLALLDAIVARVPTVCSDIPVFLESFEPDEVSFFKLEDIDSLVNAVALFDNDPVSFSQKAKLRFDNNYTQAQMVDNYLELFLQLNAKK